MNNGAMKVEENMLIKGNVRGVTKAEAGNSVLNIQITAQGNAASNIGVFPS